MDILSDKLNYRSWHNYTMHVTLQSVKVRHIYIIILVVKNIYYNALMKILEWKYICVMYTFFMYLPAFPFLLFNLNVYPLEVASPTTSNRWVKTIVC